MKGAGSALLCLYLAESKRNFGILAEQGFLLTALRREEEGFLGSTLHRGQRAAGVVLFSLPRSPLQLPPQPLQPSAGRLPPPLSQ